MIFKTERLVITKFNIDMAESVSKISLEEENILFMPDEVFETTNIAKDVINDLIECYDSKEGPFVYPILLNDKHIGHVELVDIGDKFEVGYHVSNKYKNLGYATEALKGAISYLFKRGFSEIIAGAFESNTASIKVMKKAGMNKLEREEDIEYRGTIHHCLYYSIKKSN